MHEANCPLMVSIWCPTYNQEQYIRQCLEGFVMQKTNFRFEAIVHDDASTDGTAAIVREYAKKYPDIIKPILEIENQYSKGDESLDRIMDETCTGKYIAICEGDDYWIDPLKLQMQVDFLENNPDYVLTYTNYELLENSTKQKSLHRGKCYSGNCLVPLLVEGNFIATLSVCYRRSADEGWSECRSSFPFPLLMGDKPHWLFLSGKGRIKYINSTTCVYRILEESASHSSDIQKKIDFLKNGEDITLFFNEYYKVGIRTDRIKKKYADSILSAILQTNSALYYRMALELIKKYPSLLCRRHLLRSFIALFCSYARKWCYKIKC